MSASSIFTRIGMTAGFALFFSPGLVAKEPGQVFRIELGERVVHLVGAPFADTSRVPRLEAWLLAGFGDRGLTYRRVAGTVAEAVAGLDGRILIHRPTVVVVQTGNWDLVKERHYDFSPYPKKLDELVKRLSDRGIRVLLCSPVPVQTEIPGPTKQELSEGLARWTEAAREIARRHGAGFADLFTEARDWPMIGSKNVRSNYRPVEHERSFALLQRQVRFEPAGEGAVPAAAAPVTPEKLEALREELERGQVLAAALSDISGYALPSWLRQADWAEQRAAALQRTEADLEKHDARVREILGLARPAARGGR